MIQMLSNRPDDIVVIPAEAGSHAGLYENELTAR